MGDPSGGFWRNRFTGIGINFGGRTFRMQVCGLPLKKINGRFADFLPEMVRRRNHAEIVSKRKLAIDMGAKSGAGGD
jgi:hypothetical protein